LKDSVPFREVYITPWFATPTAKKCPRQGQRARPIEIVKQYGTDAVRFLGQHGLAGTDIAFNVARTEGYRAFANKIWNARGFSS